MKKLSLVLLVSCLFVGTVSAMEPDSGARREQALDLLKAGATRVLPAVGGYIATDTVRSYAGSYGVAALLGLSSIPVFLGYTNNKGYKEAVSRTCRTAFNSLAAGVAANVVIGYVPSSVRSKFSRNSGVGIYTAGRR